MPEDITEVIRCESDIVKLMGRIMTVDKPGDLEAAQQLMDGWALQTLSGHEVEAVPARQQRDYPDPSKTNWLQRVNFVLGEGSMAEADRQWLDQYGVIGLHPGGQEFTDEQVAAAATGERLGLAHIAELAPTQTNAGKLLGTREDLQDGARDLFAVGTYLGQWGLPPVESVYMQAVTGSDGNPINGSGGKRYRMSFLAPDVSEFWSVTVYGSDDRFMAHNAINRHSRGDRTLTPDADGIFTIELSADVEANRDAPNFLPIPEKDAYLILRLYGPSQAIQEGEYSMPSVDVVD